MASPRAILSRLLVILALMLFGVPQSPADGTFAHASPAAQSKIEQSQGILTVQRHLLRAQLPDDHPSDMVVRGPAATVQQPLIAAAVSPAPEPSRLPYSIRILPPVRGPPAA